MPLKLATVFVAGICFAMLIAQAPLMSKHNPQDYPVGRYQIQPRGNTMGVWVIDTTTGHFRYFEPPASGAGSHMLVKRDGFVGAAYDSAAAR